MYTFTFINVISLVSYTKRNVFFSGDLSTFLGLEAQWLVYIWLEVLQYAVWHIILGLSGSFKNFPDNIITDVLVECIVVNGQKSRWMPVSHGQILDSSNMFFFHPPTLPWHILMLFHRVMVTVYCHITNYLLFFLFALVIDQCFA